MLASSGINLVTKALPPRPEGRVILGIDPGIADTGVGVISVAPNGRLRCVHYDSVKTKAGLPLDERLASLYEQLERLAQHFRPDLAAIEQLFFCTNVKTALVVGQARGVALLALKRQGAPLLEFTPLQVKQAVSAYGKATKLQVQRMVKTILNLDTLPQPDDAADALAIAICAASHQPLKAYGQKT